MDYSLDDWMEELVSYVPGVSIEGAKQALRATFREFTVESGAWKHELPSVSIRAGRDEYFLEPTACGTTVVLYIETLSYMTDNGTKFVRKLVPYQNPQFYSRATNNPVGEPWGYITDPAEPGKFTLTPKVTEDINNAIVPYVSLGFSEVFPDKKIPLRFKRYWYDFILDGAIGRLAGQQDKPYTNLILSQYHKKRFRRAISAARDMSSKQMSVSETDFRFPFWA